MGKNKIPLNHRLFACLDPEFQLPPDGPGTTYFPRDALFTDEAGNQRPLTEYYGSDNRIFCPRHPDNPVFGQLVEKFSCTLGLYCVACNITSWPISSWEVPCVGCGTPVSRTSLNDIELCQYCDAVGDTVSGLDFSSTDVEL